MSETKTACTGCGAEILAETAERTGGLCMPCANDGGAPEWARRRMWLERGVDPAANLPWHRSPWGGEILATCRALVSGGVGCVEGSRRLADLSRIVLDAGHGEKWMHEDWAIFFEVLPYAARDAVPARYVEQVRTAATRLIEEAEGAST